MGLLGLLIATLIVILFLVYSNSPLSPFNISQKNPKNVQTEAQDAVDSIMEKSKMEQYNVKDIP